MKASFVLLVLSTAFVAAAPNAVVAQTKQTPPAAEKKKCPDPSKLQHICSMVDLGIYDKDPESPYLYAYQRIFHEAACVDPEKDSEAEVRARIQKLWRENSDKLLCDTARLNVANGNILKFAAHRGLGQFIIDAAEKWQVDLNIIDKSDGRTVLDYIRDEIAITATPHFQAKLQSYYDTLRKAGAKHSAELKK